MLYPIGNVKILQKLDEKLSLENQVKVVRLQDKLGEQKFHEDTKKTMNQLLNHLKHLSRYNRSHNGNFY